MRNHSSALRDGLCETLVILSVHGNNLFQERLGVDIESCVSSLIRGLLTPLTLDRLLSHDRDLPHYAEAAPDEFLKLIEEDLRRPQPVVMGLLKPVESESDLLISPSRMGLLWSAGMPRLGTSQARELDPCPVVGESLSTTTGSTNQYPACTRSTGHGSLRLPFR